MKKVKLAELMALPDETRRNVLNVMQSVYQNRQRVKELIANPAPDEKSATEKSSERKTEKSKSK